jgi:hypothetical protein
MRIVIEPFMARRSRLPPADAPANLCDGQLGIHMADMPGKPGYEQYAHFSAGWSVGYSENDHGPRSEPNLCVQVRDTCGARQGGRQSECRQTVSMARPQRNAPYYFDIPDDNGRVTRHRFGLNRKPRAHSLVVVWSEPALFSQSPITILKCGSPSIELTLSR